MLERGQHALQHLTVKLPFRTLDRELRRLSAFRGRLSDDPREARDVPLERHHACLHETILELGRNPCLLSQQRVRFLGQIPEQVIDAGYVVRRLSQRTR